MSLHGVRIWLAVLGLLGGLLAAPAPVASGCCPRHEAGVGALEAVGEAPGQATATAAPDHSCCSTQPAPEPRPADDDRQGCDCPRSCCMAPGPVATIRVAAAAEAGDALVGLAPVSIRAARSAEYHLDLIRPPRS